MVKKLLSLVIMFTFLGVTSAMADDRKEDKKTEAEDTKNDKNEKEEAENLEEAEFNAVNSRPKTDSSFHSISKYNFLFYMVYKVKYGDMDPVYENKSAVAEE